MWVFVEVREKGIDGCWSIMGCDLEDWTCIDWGERSWEECLVTLVCSSSIRLIFVILTDFLRFQLS